VTVRGVVIWHPGRMGGEPTLGDTRVTVENLAGRVWAGDIPFDVATDFDLNVYDVQLACWWMVEHAPRHKFRLAWHKQCRKMWADWSVEWHNLAWSSTTDRALLPDPPTVMRCITCRSTNGVYSGEGAFWTCFKCC
jgi:uncharacterized protein (DUF433 family)